jgi:hypothetical protein
MFCSNDGARLEASRVTTQTIQAVGKTQESNGFIDQVDAAIKSSLPDAQTQRGVQLRLPKGGQIKTDLLVVSRTGVFLIDCKDYLGKIRGGMNYDYARGELWTCQTAGGPIVELKTLRNNPAQDALDSVDAVRRVASRELLRREQPHIHGIVLFPDGVDLSGVSGVLLSPQKPSTNDDVVIMPLSELPRYLSNGQEIDEQGAARLMTKLLDPEFSRSSEEVEPTTDSARKEDGQLRFENQKQSERVEAQDRRAKNRLLIIGGAVALAILLIALLLQFNFFKSPDAPELTQSQKPAGSELAPADVSPQPESPLPPSERVVPGPASVDLEPQRPPKKDLQVPDGSATRQTQEAAGAVGKRANQPAKTADIREKSQPPKETSITRRAAETGIYQTIKSTAARTNPNESAEIVDQLRPGLRLSVTGSQGDWLVVYSKTRDRTVYVKRDDAMLVEQRSPQALERDSEKHWKEIESQIQQQIAKNGITGVTVSFIRDTAYLKGTVETENQRYQAELSARSFPDVTHIHNAIKVNR